MADTGWVNPTLVRSLNVAGAGWVNTANALTENSSASGADVTTSVSDRLNTYGYDFSSIPVGSKIVGIEVRMVRRSEYATYPTDDSTLYLMADQTLKSSNYGTYQNWSTTFTAVTYGGATDLWGWTDITLDDVQSSLFGVGLQVVGGSKTAYYGLVDVIQVKIHYKLSGFMPLVLSAF